MKKNWLLYGALLIGGYLLLKHYGIIASAPVLTPITSVPEYQIWTPAELEWMRQQGL